MAVLIHRIIYGIGVYTIVSYCIDKAMHKQVKS